MVKCIKAVLFDLDGTLCDSQRFVYESFRVTLAQHNLTIPSWEDFIETCRGMGLQEAYQALTGLEDAEHLCKTHRAFQENNVHLADIFPGVRETLVAIREMEICMAIVTNRGDAVYGTLERAELTGFFETIRNTKNTRDCLQKPHPQMLLDALKHMNTNPSQAMMVGDMREDIEAGKAANVKTVVGVSYGFTGSRIAEYNPDHVIDDIRELLQILDM